MKKICYIIPYFGKLPNSFQMWMLSCEYNKSIDWILITDDYTEYNFPNNMKVIYMSFNEIVHRINDNYDFEVKIDRPWKLCEFKEAYGEIFEPELKGFDFWGHCDMDLIWGDIRKFITDDILEKYEKIGFQGHSTLYKNTKEVNSRYKTIINGKINYKIAFSSEKGYCFDEEGMCDIYNELNIPYYKEVNFAHLDRFTNSFFLGHLPKSEDYKNDRQIFIWKDGKIIRYYLFNKKIYNEEYMYLHLFSRPISFKIDQYDKNNTYVIYPDVVKRISMEKITYSFIKRKGRCSAIKFYIKIAWYNRRKITIKKILYNFKKKVTLGKSRGYK